MQFLEGLRKKPSHVKTNVALAGALLVTGLFALVWVTTLPTRFNEFGSLAEQGIEETAAVQNSLTTFFEDSNQGLDETTETEVEDEFYADPGALSGLSDWNTGTPETVPIVDETEPVPPDISPPQPVSEPAQTPTEPKIILIGTTTKKAE